MSDVTVIPCGSAISIAEVGDLYAKLLTVLAEGAAVKLDMSEIEKIDAASLQMIYAFSKEVAAQGNPLIWDSPSAAFYRSAKLLGLAEIMDIEDNAVEVV